ncbi:unnamed protein product [Cuscuta campestris]|uniref:BSD domain-containing protein n=1 Tax=Cuscuta campestris TaxID=132261 RepID=A0A484M5U4_9ASTE|nr:unnamed protein product [Cuscuta campestris]
MSSWFSLPTPFKSPDDDDENPSAPDPSLPALFRGVASFLAPPPAGSPSADGGDDLSASESSQAIAGIRSDLAEIGDSFKSSLSLLSSSKAVSEISKLASNFLNFKDDEVKEELEEEEEEEEDEEDMIGITDEVVDFVRTISERPQLWTDFPISLPDDFHISDNQKEHVETIEQLVPSLGALKQNLSNHLKDEQFWMIYFILLLPRLDDNDLEILSSPEIVRVREMLLQELQSKKNTQSAPANEPETLQRPIDGEKQPRNTDTAAEPGSSKNQTKDAEDVSFSDLEDDDDTDSHNKKVSSSSDSPEWIQLKENSNVRATQQITSQSTSRGKDSEGEESGDWLTVDDTDFDSLEAM